MVAVLAGAHGHVRHEGWVSEEAGMRRVAFLEDSAQLDRTSGGAAPTA